MAQKKFDVRILIVFLFCSLGVITGSVLLYKDYKSSDGKEHGLALATLERKELRVKRKAASSFLWSNIELKENLYLKDSVQTGENAAATIRLKDNTALELGENSLVVIDDVKNLSLNFMQGSLVLKTSDGDQKITVDQSGKTKFEQLKASLKFPESLANIFTAVTTKEIYFEWDAKDSTQTKLEIAKDKVFKQLVVSKQVNSKSSKENLPVGKYYWRISDASGPISQPGSFKILLVQATTITWPLNDTKVSLWKKDSNIQFRWVVPQNEEQIEISELSNVSYKVELATDSLFKNTYHSIGVNFSSGNSNISNIQTGINYWRMVAQFGDIKLYSKIEKFNVESIENIAVDLEYPEEKEKIDLKSELRFTWNSSSQVIDYEIEIQSQNGEKVLTQKTNSFAYIWKKPVEGTFQWRVLAYYKNQKVSESTWRKFNLITGLPVRLASPINNQEIYWWEKPKEFEFKWDEDSYTKTHDGKYLVEIAQDHEFKNIVGSYKTKNTSISNENLKVKQGTWFWRVRSLDQTGNFIRDSKPESFKYGVYPVLPPATPIAPLSGASRNILKDKGDVEFSWSEIKDAKEYEFVIYEANRTPASGSTQKVIYKKNISENKLTIEEERIKKFTDGNYQWSVRAIDPIKRKGEFMKPVDWVVTYGELLAPPEILSPEVQ